MKRIANFLLITLISFTTFSLVAQEKKFTVEDIYKNRSFFGESLRNIEWFDNGNKYSFLKVDAETRSMSIFQYDVTTGEESLLLSGNSLKLNDDDKPFMIRNYHWSPNEKYILFTGVLPARSLKTGGEFYLYDMEEKKFFLLAESEEPQLNAFFSPDGNKLAFVRGNNIFIIDIKTGEEKQLTFDGSDVIINGHFDWVYEEEFSIINGMEWSPDSRSIAYWRLDQTPVPEIQIAQWDSLYFNFLTMRYPKAGDKNSLVKIGVVTIVDAKTVWMDIGEETDIYIPRIKFTNDSNILSIQRLNREQNKNELLLADVKTGSSKIILTETDETWVDVRDDLHFTSDGKYFIWSSERDGFRHFYRYTIDGELVNQITKGNWEIDEVVAYDDENEALYYLSMERGPLYRDLYSIKYDGTNKKLLTEEKGNHSVSISTNKLYFLDTYSNANQLSSVTLRKNNGENISEIIPLKMSAFEEYKLQPWEFMAFTTTDGVELNAAMIKPNNFDETKKYPVLIFNYSGPGSQVVRDRWGGINYLWYQILADNGYIIFMCDNRGTGGRGKEFKSIVYKNLGYWEVNDMIEGAKYLSSLNYVDSDRIGIWGWSYGGYVSALALMKGADYFKAAISVAPVTHWKFYDTIYTERYMSTPQLNPEAYDESAPLNHTDKTKGRLLLVHGSADDNVHFQNAVDLVKALIESNIQFDFMMYPEHHHGIAGGNARIHLYNMMTDFILKHL